LHTAARVRWDTSNRRQTVPLQETIGRSLELSGDLSDLAALIERTNDGAKEHRVVKVGGED
jgi:predicted lipid carrier protein YhbT